MDTALKMVNGAEQCDMACSDDLSARMGMILSSGPNVGLSVYRAKYR